MTNRASTARQNLRSDPPFFPDAEGPSFCSRPTPVVPANDDAQQYPTDYPRKASGEFALGTPSSRPTYCPDDPELNLRRALRSDELLAALLEGATVNPELTPSTATDPGLTSSTEPSELEPAAGPLAAPLPESGPVARPRRLAARAVFVVLFGGMLMLLGYTFSPHIAAATQTLRAKVMGPKIGAAPKTAF
jgi:hypothetical protein